MGEPKSYEIFEAFQSYLATNSKKKTIQSQKQDIRSLNIALHYFEQKLGLTLMSEVGLECLEQLELWLSEPQKCGDISKDEWSPASILRNAKILKTIFRKAFLTGRIERDPTALWKLQGGEPLERRKPMSDQDFETILALAPDWFKSVLLMLAATGARPSSIARLKWTDVDFDKATLYFTSRKGGAKREKRIPFPITSEIKTLLSLNLENVDFCFLKNGSAISGPLISTTGHRLIKQAGLKNVQIYGLRHKFATDLLKAGTSTELARRLMGHSSEAMIKIYTSHLGIESLENAVTSMRSRNLKPSE